MSTWFKTLAAKAGLPPVSIHGLRHGSMSMQLAAGVPKVVSGAEVASWLVRSGGSGI